ncbi:MAG: hypothetical protein QNJ30_02425 [Kiloniellales bacterium]|nr:hypothetical protein [Kiloniellales bacterium]
MLFVALFPLTLSGFGYQIYDNHSLGSEAAYDYWLANGFQWGTEIIQNIGPLGFIHFPLSFTGFLDYENALANFALSGVLVALVIYLSLLIPDRVARIVFLSIFALMQILKRPYGFPMPTEVNHYLLVLFTAYTLFSSSRYVVLIPLVVLLAAMSLGKGMFLFIAPVIVLFSAFHYILRKTLFMGITTLATYMLSVLAFWVMCDQQVYNILDFVLGSFAFSSGYSEALANHGSSSILAGLCLFLSTLLILLVIEKNLHAVRSVSRTAVASGLMLGLIEIYILFAVWKHAIVSGDRYHVGVHLFFVGVCLILYMYMHHSGYYEESKTPRETPAQRRMTWFTNCVVLLMAQLRDSFYRKMIGRRSVRFFDGMIPLAAATKNLLENVTCRAKDIRDKLKVISLSDFGLGALKRWEIVLLVVVLLFSKEFWGGIHFVVFLEREVAVWGAKLEEKAAQMQMPRMREIVERESVGYFGELPAPMMYNEFSYRASPSTISFAGWNPWLIEKDAEFFRDSSKAPSYLVYELYNVADRSIVAQFSPLDSPRAQIEIFRRYDPVRDNQGNPINEIGRLLLKRREALSELEYENLGERTYIMGERIQVPEETADPIQAIIRFPPSLFTKFITFVYKAPGYSIQYRLDNGFVGNRKFTPTKAREGFLIAPLILENRDLLSALSASEWNKYVENDNSSLRRVTEFRITCDNSSIACAGEMAVQFREVDGLEFGRDSSY